MDTLRARSAPLWVRVFPTSVHFVYCVTGTAKEGLSKLQRSLPLVICYVTTYHIQRIVSWLRSVIVSRASIFHTQVKSVKVWQKPGGETFNAAASRPSDTQQMGSVANLPLPEAPSTAAMDRGVGNTPYHFILAATVINSFLLMSVIIAWSLSFYRRQCATCGNDRVSKNSGGLLGGVGALAGGRAGGYRRARTADPASLGPEVEISTY